jgi:hypothetical protein
MISRLEWLGFAPCVVDLETFDVDGFERPSSRFLRATESNEPLNTCACNFETASEASDGAENITLAT